MNEHIFGGWTRDGFYYSQNVVGGICVKCDKSWAALEGALNSFINDNTGVSLTISDIKSIIKNNSPCPITDEEFRLRILLS